jgi:type IV secretory pathway VirB3-like protein
MNHLESAIREAVAYPPTLLFVPVELAGLNLAVHIGFMLLAFIAFGISPAIWLVSAVVCHIVLIVLSSRDAHIVNYAKAIGRSKPKSENIVPSEGVKYVP